MRKPTSGGYTFRRGFLAVCAALILALSGPALHSEDGVLFTLTNTTRGPLASLPVYVTLTCVNPQGGFQRMDSSGAFHPCRASDNSVPRGGRTWCAYSFPLTQARRFSFQAGQHVIGARLYLSVGAPLFLRVDPASGGLVQPDLGNPSDPNAGTIFDWVEFTLDDAGFHGNTTCVDQFALPITLQVVDASGASAGPVGITESRHDLFRDFQASVPGPFGNLADPGGLRITAPGHAPGGPLLSWLNAYIQEQWTTYRNQPLILTPAEGTFTGSVEPGGAMVFTRPGDPAEYRIRAIPTTQEAFRCDGVLASGTILERVLGAQIGAMLNRHILGTPADAADPAAYYRSTPNNCYARFWHQHSLNHKAYGFPYDDVNSQSTLLQTHAPREVQITFRVD